MNCSDSRASWAKGQEETDSSRIKKSRGLEDQLDLWHEEEGGLSDYSQVPDLTAGYMILPSPEINTGLGLGWGWGLGLGWVAGFRGSSEEEEGAMMRSVWDILSFICVWGTPVGSWESDSPHLSYCSQLILSSVWLIDKDLNRYFPIHLP